MSKNTKSKTASAKKLLAKKPKKIVLDLDSDDEIDSDNEQVDKKKKHNDDTEDFESKLESIKQALRENYSQQKKLMNDLKELLTLHKKEIKLVSKSGNRSNSGKNSGFNKPEIVPISLRKLLKIQEEMLPRSKVTAIMYQYFTDNKMYNTKTKKEIIPNSKIRTIFGMNQDDVVNFYNLQTWLKKVYDENSSANKTLNIGD